MTPTLSRTSSTIAVVGGSLGGLIAANLLCRAGWDVHVYEKAASDLESRGAGLVIQSELLAVLAEAGVLIDETIGVNIKERITLLQDGSVAGTLQYPQIYTAWSTLYHKLRQALPAGRYHLNKELIRVEQDQHLVSLSFDDGTEVQASLLLAADGVHSRVRHLLNPTATLEYAGYVAWRGMVEESLLSTRALTELFPYIGFSLPPHEQILGYPVPGADQSVCPGERRYNFVWYRPAPKDTVLHDLLTDSTGKTWPEGIAPPLIRPEIIDQTRLAAHTLLPPQFAEVVDQTEHLFFQPVFDLSCDRLVSGRVAIMGDAAFVARPHCAMGTTKAAGDAKAFVTALLNHSDHQQALGAYERSRLRFGRMVMEHARELGAYMQVHSDTLDGRVMQGHQPTPEAIMRDIGVPLASWYEAN